MTLRKKIEKRKSEKMSDRSFRIMNIMFKVIDFIYPYIGRRTKKFGILEGMTVVDYGCGPGRYSVKFTELVGDNGKVYAVDIQELAIEAVQKKMQQYNLTNIEPILISGYESTLPDHVADVVCAIDMFFVIQKPTEFLGELKRITKPEGMLIIDDGHQPRRVTKKKILDSDHWKIVKETWSFLKCRPK